MRMMSALLPSLVLISLGLSAPASGDKPPEVEIEWGTITGQLPGPAPDLLDVALAGRGRECVRPDQAELRHLDTAVVADNEWRNVRLMRFESAWRAAKAGEIKLIKACAAETEPT